MTPLRGRMMEDMRLAGLCESTQETYIRVVKHLAKFYNRSPDMLTEDEVAAYLRGLIEKQVGRGTFKTARFGIQFLYQNTLQRDWGLLKKRCAFRSRNACHKFSRPIAWFACYA